MRVYDKINLSRKKPYAQICCWIGKILILFSSTFSIKSIFIVGEREKSWSIITLSYKSVYTRFITDLTFINVTYVFNVTTGNIYCLAIR